MSAAVKAVKKIGKGISKIVKKAADTVVNTVKAVIKDPLPTILSLAGQAIGIPAPVTMAAITAARGGDLEDIAKSAAISFVAPKIVSSVSSVITPAIASTISNPTVATAVTNSIGQGLVSGSVAAIQGGDFSQGFAGGAVGSAVASGMQQIVTPSVLQTAKDLGFSTKTGEVVSSIFTAGAATGAATAVTGGDFGQGFENGVASLGVDYATQQAGSVLKDAYNKVFGDKTLTTSAERAITASNKLDEMLASDKLADMVANDKSASTFDKDAAYNQMLEEFSKPASEGVGTQIGDPLAANTLATMPGYETIAAPPAVDYAGTFIPKDVVAEPDTPAQQSQLLDEFKKAAISGDTSLLTEATQLGELPPTKETTVSSETKVEPLYPEVNFGNIPAPDTTTTLYPEVNFGNIPTPSPTTSAAELERIANEANQKANLINQQHDALLDEINKYDSSPVKTPEQTAAIEQKVEQYNKDYEVTSGEVSDLKQTYDDIKSKLLEGQAPTVTGELPIQEPSTGIVGTPTFPVSPEAGIPAPSVDYQKNADIAYNNYVNAEVIANITKTPEAIAAAEDAKLNAELSQRILDEFVRQSIFSPTSKEVINTPTTGGVVTPGGLPTTDTTGGTGIVDGTTGGTGVIGGTTGETGIVDGTTGGTTGGTGIIDAPTGGLPSTGGTASGTTGGLPSTDGVIGGTGGLGEEPLVTPPVTPPVNEEPSLPPVEVYPEEEIPEVVSPVITPPVVVPPVVPPVVTPPTGGGGDIDIGGGGGTRPVQSGLTSQGVTYNKPQPYYENPSFTLFPIETLKPKEDPFSKYFRIGGLAAIRKK